MRQGCAKGVKGGPKWGNGACILVCLFVCTPCVLCAHVRVCGSVLVVACGLVYRVSSELS